MVQYGDSTVYFSRIGDRHLRYPGKLRRPRKALLRGWKLTHILNTHWHGDHTGGNEELKRRHGCVVVGPRAEAPKIPGLDQAVGQDDLVHLGAFTATVWPCAVPVQTC